jgi:hypothetical protein
MGRARAAARLIEISRGGGREAGRLAELWDASELVVIDDAATPAAPPWRREVDADRQVLIADRLGGTAMEATTTRRLQVATAMRWSAGVR